jgi:hypothetical protein
VVGMGGQWGLSGRWTKGARRRRPRVPTSPLGLADGGPERLPCRGRIELVLRPVSRPLLQRIRCGNMLDVSISNHLTPCIV